MAERTDSRSIRVAPEVWRSFQKAAASRGMSCNRWIVLRLQEAARREREEQTG
jgi:predicted HicB family RNase H-like nuclease